LAVRAGPSPDAQQVVLSEAHAHPDQLTRALNYGVSAEFGGPDAAAFLTGSTVEELEASADGLGRLIAEHRERSEPEPDPATPDLLTEARTAQRERTARLAAMFTGRPKPPGQSRNELGRFASFDGGARAPVPAPRDPHQEHDQVILGLATMRALGGG
jgi:hypothetical protein